jgi:hypothetical protein
MACLGIACLGLTVALAMPAAASSGSKREAGPHGPSVDTPGASDRVPADASVAAVPDAAAAPYSRAALAEIGALAAYGDLPLNDLRFLGTHNSYHRSPRLFGIPFLPIAFSGSHRYTHPPLAVQLEGLPDGSRAVRQLEIDVHMRRFDDQIRVFHLPWIDNRSTCKTLKRCLEQLRDWSDERGGEHAPILIWIEPKDETPLDRWLTLGWYEHVDLARVEEVIEGVIPRARILTPDDLRRGEPTLPDAIRKHGWPTLDEARGRFIFALLDESEHRDAYVARSPNRNLAGQLMFVRSTSPDEPWAAMFKVNNAVPTLRDMQAFGREALADPDLVALQVHPSATEEPMPDSPFRQFFMDVWSSMQTSREAEAAEERGERDERDVQVEGEGLEARGEGAGEASAEPESRPSQQPDVGSGPEARPELETGSEPDPNDVGVARALRRELRSVDNDTPSDERARHRAAVAALENETLVSHERESEELGIVLRNAELSRAYRALLVERLRDFLAETERAQILQLASRGFLVTTTADDQKKTGAENRERAASALFSAAQFISTDALVPQRDGAYTMPFPGRPIGCNSLIDRDACEAARPASGPPPSSP